MPLVYIALRGRLVLPLRSAETWKVLLGGVFGLLSYGVVIWALTLAPMGRVSALRVMIPRATYNVPLAGGSRSRVPPL